jgi:hypothetical protein
MTVKQQLVLADRLIALALGLGCFRFQSVKSISGSRVHYGARQHAGGSEAMRTAAFAIFWVAAENF